MRVDVSERAKADLRAIWRWTFETFGLGQADRYLDELNGAIRACGERPQMGRDRSEVRPGYRSVAVRSHVIFYTCANDVVLIRRVLHGGMDVDSHL